MNDSAASSWHRYWFAPTAVVDLAVCRVAAVGVQLYTLITWQHFYFDTASLPAFIYRPLPLFHVLSIPLGGADIPTLSTISVIYWITLAAGVLALLGAATNLALVVLSLGSFWLHGLRWSFMDFHHSDALVLITLVSLMLSPCGRAFSVDRWASRRFLGKRSAGNLLSEESQFAGWPLKLVQWLFALIYLSAGMCKVLDSGTAWLNGYTLQYYLFEDALRWDSPFGTWLAQFHLLAVVSCWFTILFECSFICILFWPKLRKAYLPAGAILHTLIYATIRANYFGYIVLYAVFIPWRDVWVQIQQWKSTSKTARHANEFASAGSHYLPSTCKTEHSTSVKI